MYTIVLQNCLKVLQNLIIYILKKIFYSKLKNISKELLLKYVNPRRKSTFYEMKKILFSNY